jgi:hypothetical protein
MKILRGYKLKITEINGDKSVEALIQNIINEDSPTHSKKGV